MHFRVNTIYSCLNVKELLVQNSRDIWSLTDSNGIQTHNHLVHKWTLNRLAKLAFFFFNDWAVLKYLSVRCIWLYVVIMPRTRFRVNPHSIVAWMSRNFARNRCNIWRLSDSNGIRTHNCLVHKRTLNHLAKLAKN